MNQHAINRLQLFLAEVEARPVSEFGPSSDQSYWTFFASDESPCLTITRPRVLDRAGLFTVAAVDGTIVAYLPNASRAAVVKEVRAYVRAGAGLDSMSPEELKAESEDAKARAANEFARAGELKAPESRVFKAGAMNRGTRAVRRHWLSLSLCAAKARDAGHDMEEQADSTTGEERAALLERAATFFDMAGGIHCPARATTCRNAAKEARKAPATIDATPTWTQVMPGLIAVLMNGTSRGQSLASEELLRLAEQVDRINGRSVGAMEVPKAAPAPRKARLKSRKELEDMARDEEARPIARELAAMGLQAIGTGQSGGFPLYAYRDARPLSPEELDSLIYDTSGAFN